MSKERLGEINDKFNKSGIFADTKDIQYLIEQAEQVQELERVNKQLKNNLSVYKGYYKNMIKINEDTVEENKKYRRLIKNMGQEIEVLTDVVSNADNADELNEEVIRLKGVLKNEVS